MTFYECSGSLETMLVYSILYCIHIIPRLVGIHTIPTELAFDQSCLPLIRLPLTDSIRLIKIRIARIDTNKIKKIQMNQFFSYAFYYDRFECKFVLNKFLLQVCDHAIRSCLDFCIIGFETNILFL